MALSVRQQSLYTDRVNIWHKQRQKNTDGTFADDTFVLLYSNIPCKFEYTLNVDDPTEVGSFKRKSTFTTDTLHLPLVLDNGQTLTVPNGAWFVNVTPNNPNRKSVSIGQGASNILPGIGVRAGLNKMLIQVMSEEKPPSELLVGVS